MAEALARRGARVIGVDPSMPALAAARRHAETSGLTIDYRHGYGADLPVAAGSVDVVLSVDVLEHVPDLDAVLAEIHRVLRPGSLFLFDTINRTCLAALVLVTFGEQVLRVVPAGAHDPALFIPPSELMRKLAAHGFSAGSVRSFGPRGLDHRLDITFGPLSSTAVMYIGDAHTLT
jgi:2-polyprenyl-6-hydroxyphenyl methylase / 3-demethylubiquinone-9 3-methyltransferase